MRGNNYQIDVTFFRNAHNLGGSFAMNHELLDIDGRADDLLDVDGRADDDVHLGCVSVDHDYPSADLPRHRARHRRRSLPSRLHGHHHRCRL